MPPKIKSITEIREELLQRKKLKLLRAKQAALPDFLAAYFEETKDFEPVPALLLYKPYLYTVQHDENRIYELYDHKLQYFQARMQKVDDQLYCKQENAKFRQYLKSEIYQDKMEIQKQLKAELELEKQIKLMEEQMKQKKQEMLVQLEEQKRLQRVAEQALLKEYNRKTIIQRQRQYRELYQERSRAMILLKYLKTSTQAELIEIDHQNYVERQRMLAAMKEGILCEERYAKTELVKPGREANERLIKRRISMAVSGAAKDEERRQLAYYRKAEMEMANRVQNAKAAQRAERATQLIEQRKQRVLALQQERIRVYALSELLGE